jgi:hypothetical protein
VSRTRAWRWRARSWVAALGQGARARWKDIGSPAVPTTASSLAVGADALGLRLRWRLRAAAPRPTPACAAIGGRGWLPLRKSRRRRRARGHLARGGGDVQLHHSVGPAASPVASQVPGASRTACRPAKRRKQGLVPCGVGGLAAEVGISSTEREFPPARPAGHGQVGGPALVVAGAHGVGLGALDHDLVDGLGEPSAPAARARGPPGSTPYSRCRGSATTNRLRLAMDCGPRDDRPGRLRLQVVAERPPLAGLKQRRPRCSISARPTSPWPGATCGTGRRTQTGGRPAGVAAGVAVLGVALQSTQELSHSTPAVGAVAAASGGALAPTVENSSSPESRPQAAAYSGVVYLETRCRALEQPAGSRHAEMQLGPRRRLPQAPQCCGRCRGWADGGEQTVYGTVHGATP